jgi:diguanylate cyclase
MKYKESIEQSAEYLRRALPLMSRQTAALNPISYAVWYEYVAGINPALRTRIDELTGDGRTLNDESTVELFRKHVAEVDEELAQRIGEGFQKIMADISRSAAEAGSDAGQFGMALEQWSAGLKQSGSLAVSSADLAMLMRHTRDMQQSMTVLNTRLDESNREIEGLRVEVSRAREDALADGLTGLTNRRGFDIALAACLEASTPADRRPSLLIADIDHFKRVNDSYGHLFGDKVIRAVAKVLKDNVKGRDTAARYGGEEFVVLLPNTPIEGARSLAEQIRTTVERCRIKRADNQELIGNVTVSLGVACHNPGESASEFVARADSALYASKSQGRNRVTLAARTS